MTFARDIARFNSNTIKNLGEVRRRAAFALFSDIITSTPVDKGTLRNNWFVTGNAPSQMTVTTTSGVSTRVRTDLLRIEPDDDIFFTNNLPYASRIEFEGHSAQAPAGMVRINTVNWGQYVSNAARSLR